MRQPVLLNADLTENRRISPVAMSIVLNRVPLSTASIQLTEDETIPARAWVELFTPKGSAGIFRAREPDNTYGDRIATVELEHAIAEVGNSIVAEKLEEEMPLNNAMARLFGHYKGSVWQMATIPYADTVTVDVDYENVLEAINRLIKQTPYMMVFDFSTMPWTFGLAQTDESVTAEGRLSRNVMTGSIKYDDSNMATRAYAAYDDGEGQEALVYEDDAAAIAQYGLIEKKLNEVYANETKARAAAVKYLQAYNRPKVSISVNGEELIHITGESLDAFEVGKRMRFVFDADETPIDEIIDSVRYEDLVADENGVTVSMAEEDDYEYVLNELKDSNKRTRTRINRINEEIHRDLWSSDGRLHSQLDLTASHLRTYFEDTAEGYWSEIEQTASYWRSVYGDAQNNLGIIEQTASYWRSTYTDAQNNLGIIEQTASYWRSTYTDAQNNLGQIEQTASYWRSTYADAQNNLGVIEQTASYWRSSYQSIGGLLGEIEQTASYWRNTYSDTANSLRSEVQQTASYWRTQLVNEGTNQRSSIVQTAASLTFTADQIYLDGDTKISDILGINSSGFLTVDGDIYQTGTIYPGGVTINRGGDLKMWTGGATGDIGSQVSLTGMDVNDMIVKADVSGNTLTLWKRGADLSASSGDRIINFSKATTLSGSWGSGEEGDEPLGKFSVIATQNGSPVGTVVTNITYAPAQITWDNNVATVPLYATIGTSAEVHFVRNITVNATGAFDSGASGVTVDSIYGTELSSNAARTSVYITATASNNKYKTEQLILSNPTTYTDGNNVSHRCVELIGKYYDSSNDTEISNVAIGRVNVDSVYNAGWDGVTLSDPDWQYPANNHNSDNTTASNSVVVAASSKTNGDVRSKTIPISLNVDTANKKAKVSAGGYVRAIANIDMKTNAEYNTAVANAGYAGRAAVTISDTIKWGTEPSSGINVSSNSIKVSTAGRTTSDGTIQQSEKTINLYTQSSVSGLTATFYVTHTDSTDAKRILKKTATCADTNLKAANIKSGVSIFGVTGSYVPNYYNADSFDTTAAETSVQVNGHYNNSDGYYISSNSRNADVQINVKGTWTHGGGSETHYSWIEGAAGRLYRRGYDNGASGGASHAITGFDTTNASTSETYNNLTNNSDGYVISGTGPNANAFIVTKSTWKCDGQDKSALSYLASAPKSLYHEAFMRGWANYYDDPDWWEAPSSSNGNKCYIPNRSRTGKTLWFTVSSSGSNYTSLGSGWYYTVTALANGKYKHSFVLEMASNSYKGLKDGTNYTLYK